MTEGVLTNKKINSGKYNIYKYYIILVLGITVSLFIGRYKIEVSEINSLFAEVFSGGKLSSSAYIVFNIRLPRILLALSVGGVLSISGLIFQKIFRNPIASPDILGITSGASFGAALGIVVPSVIYAQTQIFAFIFGCLAVLIVYKIKDVIDDDSIIYLVLSGIIVSSFFTALLSIIKYIADPFEKLPSIVFWTMGGLYKTNWISTLLIMVVSIPAIIIINKLSFKLDILSLNDEEAISLGIDVKKYRQRILVLLSLVISLCVSVTGTIGWIALIIPHIVRSISRDDKMIYFITPFMGGMVLLLLDNIARTMSTSEIPIGILTALVGAPLLAYYIIKRKVV